MSPGRTPPSDLMAEESLLGAMMIPQAAVCDVVLGMVAAEDFYRPANGHIFAACMALHDQGAPVDSTTVADELRRAGLLDAIGGAATLITLMANTPATSNAGRYATIVADMAQLRRLAGLAAEISEIAYSAPADVPKAIAECELMLDRLADSRSAGAVGVPFHQAMADWLDQMEAMAANTEPVGVRTGILDLDDLMLGLRRGELVTIGARPGVGKSVLGSQIAFNAARTGHPTLLFGIEMPTDQTFGRIVAAEARVDYGRIRSGKLNEQDWQKIPYFAGTLAGTVPLAFVDDPTATIATIRAECRRQHKRAGLEVVVVDYLQIIKAAKSENRQVEVAEISGGLRRIAREMGVVVVALVQLSRNLEYRADKRPTLADLRESGAIEQDSDVVIGIYRDEIYDPESPDRGMAELLVLKHRNGALGVVRTAFVNMAFRNMARM